MTRSIDDGIKHWSELARKTNNPELKETATRNSEFLSEHLHTFQRSLVRRPIPKNRQPIAFSEHNTGA